MALRRHCWVPLLLATLLVSLVSRAASQSVLPCITFNEEQTPGTVTVGVLTAVGLFDSISSSVRIMANLINSDATILPNTTLRIVVYNTNLVPALALSSFIKSVTASPGVVVIIGPPTSGESTVVGSASSVDIFQIPIVSGSATSATLSDKLQYPYFSRVVPADSYQGQALASLVAHFHWNKTACISTTNDYGVNGILAFEAAAAQLNITIAAYQQFLPGATDVFVQVRELLNSKARVFVAFMLTADFQTVITQAQNATTNIIGPQYVWLCADGCATNSDNLDLNNNPVPLFQNATHGIIGTLPAVARGPAWDAFQAHWESLDQKEYPGLTPQDEAFTYAGYYADATTAIAMGLDAVFRSGTRFNGTVLTNAIRNATFMGLTGPVAFLPNGDRQPFYDVVNFRNETNQTLLIGGWSQDGGLNLTIAPEFWSGSTTPPDLDVRPPYNYWSCFDKVERTDPTGKKVPLEAPDFGNPNNINSSYICDGYLDCNNMSDEWDCSVSMPIVFIVFGIFTGILFLIPVFIFLPFTIIFGFISPRSRVRQASPEFLLVMILACCLGYGSTYAWYGKPQVVACNFQSWLLGTGAILLLAALLVRGFRLWYLIFSAVRRPGKSIRFGVWKMSLMAFGIMVPA